MTTTLVEKKQEVIGREFCCKDIIDVLNLEGHLVIIPESLQVDSDIEESDQGKSVCYFFFLVVTVKTASFDK